MYKNQKLNLLWAPLILAPFFLLCILSVPTFAEDIKFDLDINDTPDISIRIGDMDLVVSPTFTGPGFGEADLNVDVKSAGGTNGYTLFMETTSTALTSGSGDRVNTLGEYTGLGTGYNCTEATASTCDFTLNSWGYKMKNDDHYIGVELNKTIKETTSAATDWETTTLTFAGRISNTLPGGDYSTEINFTAVANPIAYTINFNKGDTTNSVTLPTTLTGPIDTTSNFSVNLNGAIASRTGYNFKGWCDTMPTAGASGSADTCHGSTTPTYTSNSNVPLYYKNGEDTKTLYAMWQVKSSGISIKTTTGISSVSLLKNNVAVCTASSATAVSCDNLNYDDTYTLTATTSTGYSFSSWTLDPTTQNGGGTLGSNTTTDNGDGTTTITTTYTVGTNGALIYPNATANTYTITIKTNANISKVTLNGTECTSASGCAVSGLTYGQQYNLVATVDSGYSFSSWKTPSPNYGAIASSSSYSTKYLVGAGNATIQPNVASVNSYAISLKTIAHINSVSLKNSSNETVCTVTSTTATKCADLPYGSEYTLVASPATGYSFSGSWTKSGSGILSGSKFTVGAGAATIYPASGSATVNSYPIYLKTIANISSVSLKNSSNETVCTINSTTATKCADLSYGSSYTLVASPATGYNFSGSWTKSGSGTLSGSTFTVGAGTATLYPASGSATAAKYTITIKTATGISSVSLNGTSCTSTSGCNVSNLIYGQSYTLAATVDTGYTFSSWSATKGTIDDNNISTTYRVGAGNATITPSASISTHNVTVNFVGGKYSPYKVTFTNNADRSDTSHNAIDCPAVVVATNGDSVYDAIIDYIINRFRNEEGIDLSTDAMAMQRIEDAAQNAADELDGGAASTTITLPFITATSDGAKHLNYTITTSNLYNVRMGLSAAISSYIINRFRNEEGIDLSTDAMAMQRIEDAAQNAADELDGGAASTTITLPFITATSDGPKHIEYTITRADIGNITSSSGNNVSLCEGMSYTITMGFVDMSKGEFNGWSKTGNATIDNITSVAPNYAVTGTATLSAIGKARTSMQNIASSQCTTTAKLVLDNRDDTIYTIQRLEDNKCWMLDNLALDLTDAKVKRAMIGTTGGEDSKTNAPISLLEHMLFGGEGTTSDQYATAKVSSSWSADSYSAPLINMASKDVVPSDSLSQAGNWKVGGYYNYCAASAGSYCYGDGANAGTSTGNAEYDICPSGWRMPTGGASGEYQALATAITGITGNISDTTKYNNFRNTLNTPLSGNIYNGSAINQGSYGAFWSSTRGDNKYIYRLFMDTTTVYPQDYNDRSRGYSVRCILAN